MKRGLVESFSFGVFTLLALIVPVSSHANSPEQNIETLFDSTIRGLTENSGEELLNFIRSLRADDPKEPFTDQQIDRIVEKLTLIQERDMYKGIRGKNSEWVEFTNRVEAQEPISRYKFQKIANRLRKLPLEQRVTEIIDGIVNPPLPGVNTTRNFIDQLILQGKDAVPCILQHKPEQRHHRQAIAFALSSIGDNRGLDYVLEAFSSGGDGFKVSSELESWLLAPFQDERALIYLVEALKDQTCRSLDKHQPQQAAAPEHVPYIAMFYNIQAEAAASLTKNTGKNWGLLYNEDYKTWHTWLLNENGREGFDPRAVPRTREEISGLIHRLYDRYMSGRPHPSQSENLLAGDEGIHALAQDLSTYSLLVVPEIVSEYQARVDKQPMWKKELETWTKKLLLAFGWDAATTAARQL